MSQDELSADFVEAAGAKVRVLAPFRVVWETEAFTGGDELTVDEKTAADWEVRRFVERLPGPKTKVKMRRKLSATDLLDAKSAASPVTVI